MWEMSIWIGFDGTGDCDALLQAGTFSFVQIDDAGAETEGQYVWVEWYPEESVPYEDRPCETRGQGSSFHHSIVRLSGDSGGGQSHHGGWRFCASQLSE